MVLPRGLKFGFWILVFAMFAGVITMLFTYVPREATMGDVQKIFYFHVPIAINMFLGALLVFIASIGYVLKRTTWWDDLALAAAKVTVLLATIVLVTGMIWGKSAWGQWWDWKSTRLVSSLALWLLYLVYLMIRPSVESAQKRALISAVYGIIAFLDVPLVYLSARLIPDTVHPPSITLEPEMRNTFLAWLIPVTLLAIGMVVVRFDLNRRSRLLEMQAASNRRGRAASGASPTAGAPATPSTSSRGGPTS